MNKLTYKIVVIDDDPGDVEILSRYLIDIEDYSFEIHQFKSLKELYHNKLCADCDIDIIFLDYLLGGETGIEIIHELKNKNCRKPIIMLTGQGSELVAVEAMKAGISDYLIKDTISSSTLKKTIENTLEKESLRNKIIEQEKLLKQQVVTDELTSLYNRRYLMNFLMNELQRSQRYSTTVSIILIDLDHFKHVNDTYGHLIGDQVLTKMGGLLKDQQRSSDIACRYGGEEFCMVLPNTDNEGAEVLSERIRTSLSELPFYDENGIKFNVTCSIGVAQFQNNKIDIDSLLKNADQALYQSKSEGRNRTTVYKES